MCFGSDSCKIATRLTLDKELKTPISILKPIVGSVKLIALSDDAKFTGTSIDGS
jgi:hypothetical protein